MSKYFIYLLLSSLSLQCSIVIISVHSRRKSAPFSRRWWGSLLVIWSLDILYSFGLPDRVWSIGLRLLQNNVAILPKSWFFWLFICFALLIVTPQQALRTQQVLRTTYFLCDGSKLSRGRARKNSLSAFSESLVPIILRFPHCPPVQQNPQVFVHSIHMFLKHARLNY